jgi:hypothetical protein
VAGGPSVHFEQEDGGSSVHFEQEDGGPSVHFEQEAGGPQRPTDHFGEEKKHFFPSPTTIAQL